ncbi:hypothetical protein DNHGIG_36660 [Collibacillus ludicampi]|uniref:Uncharacterized protein n=1 Tax=Collibacillus ludicampi TaxID=2771369 RepID=A0AAV4LLG7_9BACL|nr:TatD family hydrolase [Collibacillus ludicampi]GIM48117.1 hypothetical protein DNHGIG_36660 [Collibacillus ludicampi]
MIDTHIHLAQYARENIDRLIDHWWQRGIQRVVAVSTDLSSSYHTLELKLRYPDFIDAAVGFHPEYPTPAQNELEELIRLIKQERQLIAAIGEVGLPHYSLPTAEENKLSPYLEYLEIFAKIACEEDLPIVLHAVHDKAAKALQMMLEQKVSRVHFHWLKAPHKVVKQMIQAGYFISVTPEVCYRERDQQLVCQVPLQNLMLETDGPWPYSHLFEDQLTTPLFLYDVARKVADLKGMSFETVSETCNANAKRFYGNQ